jgi:hypothetical protein
MKEDWTEQLKRKLEGHKMPPPEGLWEDITKQMGFSSEPVRKPTAIKRLYWVAAAAILALVGFFVFQNGNDNEQPLQAEVSSQQPDSPQLVSTQPAPEQSASELPVSGPSDSEHTVPQQSASHPILALVQTQTSSRHDEANQQETTAEPISEETESMLPEPAVPSSSENQQTEPSQTQKKQPHQENRIQELPDEWLTERSSLASSRQWSIGVNASGGLLAANTFQRTDRLYSQHGTFTYNGDKSPTGPAGWAYGEPEKGSDNYQGYYFVNNYSYTLTEYVSKHHLPIRFGLSVQYQLNNHLALHSGISYTYLYSEFSIPLYQNLSYDQKLHYLGIPLGVTWQLWSTNRFHFYLSGGAMVEKCVRADVDGSSVSKKPWQWSVAAAAGAEYTFIPQLGVYLEPSLGYYFDDGTSLEHYYKEHSLVPSIMFGLRLHLNE